MMLLNNKTPFAAEMMLLPNEQGVDTLYTIVKASFNIGKKWTLSEEQIAPQTDDECWGDPNDTSIKYPVDYHCGKPSSDIIVLGDACAPASGPVTELDVGSVHKVLRIYGDRTWSNGYIRRPESFDRMPIIYENAFGGTQIVDDKVKSAEQRNPVGKGFKGKRSRSEMDGRSLPNIENPRQLIGDMLDEPDPAGFGVIASHWSPRSNYGGTYDEVWQEERAPYLPKDYDSRFQNSASPGLIYPEYLVGGEPVKIVNMHEQGTINFELPRINIKGRLKSPFYDLQKLQFNMETLILKPNELKLHMVWKSAFVCGSRASKIRSVDLSLMK